MNKKGAILVLLLCLAAAAAWSAGIEELRQKLARSAGAERGPIVSELVKALTARGDEAQKRQDYKGSLAYYHEALKLLEDNGPSKASPHLLNRTGLAEIILGNYDKALEYLLRSLAAAEASGDRPYISSSSYLIGYVHRDLGNLDLAMKYFNAALESAQEEGNQRLLIMALNEIGNVHVYRGQPAQALPFKERSLKLARKYRDRELLANCLHDMGNLYLTQDQPAKALAYFQEALAIDRESGQVRGIVIALVNTADAYRRLGRFPAALVCLDEARALAGKAGQEKDLSVVLSMYSHVHEGRGDFRQALDFQRQYEELWQKLFNEEKTRQTAEMQTRFEVEKKQRENELLRREKQIAALATAKQRNQRNFLFFVALLVLLLAAVLYRGLRAESRAHRELAAANDRIVAQQAQLEKAYRDMEGLARLDPLTGLPNRRTILEEIERERKRFQRSQKPFTLAMADLVGLKTTNDTMGHDAGDYVLTTASGIFSASLRGQDMVARWGGDEFLFLLPETDAHGARVICESIQKAVSGHGFRFNEKNLKVEVSMGTSTFRAASTIEECLREADQAMYRSRGEPPPGTSR